MRPIIPALVAALLVAPAAWAQMTDNGARPGNVIGTGSSLPLGTSASNINPYDTRSAIAPNLPPPPVDPNAGTFVYLRAARGAIAAGRTGEGQQALEMAETRALDRSVAYDATNRPSGNPLIARISQALQALGAGDRASAVGIIDEILAHRAR